jgi:hypothetical protein
MKNIISKVILGSFVVGAVGMANAQKIDAKLKRYWMILQPTIILKRILTSNFLLEAA